ncbi:hypothetical protein Acsp06_43680 [Actinomycetospora sp. NBRC 106375]|nr:hypothetical protein Acsp06_43680 [Actinomycetospora sp. NBRC 106375]
MPRKEDRLKATIDSGHKEHRSIRRFVSQSVRRVALQRYLSGFPAGLLIVAVAVFYVSVMRFQVGEPGVNRQLATCLGAGAIGAVVSVMVRLTRGQQLDIDTDQTHLMTALAGAFRPIIGAVLAAALFTFIQGGLVPIAVPTVGAVADVGLFFCALAFLAGFSERWAQDTIVHSLPPVRIGRASSSRGSRIKLILPNSRRLRAAEDRAVGGGRHADGSAETVVRLARWCVRSRRDVAKWRAHARGGGRGAVGGAVGRRRGPASTVALLGVGADGPLTDAESPAYRAMAAASSSDAGSGASRRRWSISARSVRSPRAGGGSGSARPPGARVSRAFSFGAVPITSTGAPPSAHQRMTTRTALRCRATCTSGRCPA